MSINWLSFVLLTLAQYIIGALWFSVFFKNQWILINHPEGTPSKQEMERMGKEAVPYFGIQLLLQIIYNYAFVYIYKNSNINWLVLSLTIWFGFFSTMIVQSVIWSDPKNKRKLLQISIVSLEMLVLTVFSGWVFSNF
jgi:Protein of unknown function (DUF1761)